MTVQTKKSGNSSKRALGLSIQIGVPVLLLLVWWFVSDARGGASFPPLRDILVEFKALWLFDHFMSDVVPSLVNLLLGFTVAVVLGIATGLLFALLPAVAELFSPAIHLYRAIPSVAVVPVFISLFGFGDEVRLMIIVLAAFAPTWIATMDGVRAVEPQLLNMSRVYRITPLERVLGIQLPGALPQIFSGLQVSLQFSFVVLIATEMLGASRGIGSMTILAQQSFMSVSMWAGIILLGVIGFGANFILEMIRKPLLRWYDKSRAAQLRSEEHTSEL